MALTARDALRMYACEAVGGFVVAGHVPAGSGGPVRSLLRAMRVHEAAEARSLHDVIDLNEVKMQHDLPLHVVCGAMLVLFAKHDMQCAHVLVALSELFQRAVRTSARSERASREGSDPPMTSVL